MSPTALLIRDELKGFAKSRVMLVLWLLMPALAFAGYALISNSSELRVAMGGDKDQRISATAFIALLLSSIAATVAALMLAVDVVSERQRKVYELFVIRPIRRDAILIAKFVSVWGCVSVACLVAIGLGLGLDAMQGDSADLADVSRHLVSMIGAVGLAAAIGIFFGVTSSSILVAVILVQFVGQNVIVIPMVPTMFGLPASHWWLMGVTGVMIVLVMAGSIALFRKSEF